MSESVASIGCIPSVVYRDDFAVGRAFLDTKERPVLDGTGRSGRSTSPGGVVEARLFVFPALAPSDGQAAGILAGVKISSARC